MKKASPILNKIWGTRPFPCYFCKGGGFTITHGGNPPVYHPPHHKPHHHHWGSYGHRFGWTSYGWRFRTYGVPVVTDAAPVVAAPVVAAPVVPKACVVVQ